jgi:hypothetical protein
MKEEKRINNGRGRKTGENTNPYDLRRWRNTRAIPRRFQERKTIIRRRL